MKLFEERIGRTLLLLEEEDLIGNIAYKLRGNHVDYVIAPIEAKENEDFVEQVSACIEIQGYKFGKVLYYET